MSKAKRTKAKPKSLLARIKAMPPVVRRNAFADLTPAQQCEVKEIQAEFAAGNLSHKKNTIAKVLREEFGVGRSTATGWLNGEF